nr:hypothetical protein [Tanacetum cinerariifolium]
MWKQIKRLMHGTYISKQERHSRLMNKFDKFMAEDGESLTSVYERFSTLIKNIDQNEVKPREISINTKLLNSLQPEWSKYVTLTRQRFNCNDVIGTSYHTTIFNSNQQSTSYFIRHKESSCDPRWSCGIQSKNAGYVRNGNRNIRRLNRNQATNAGNGLVSKIKMLLAAKDEVGVNLDAKENEFMLMNPYDDDQLEELNASVIMMAHIQPTDDKSDAESTYDAKVISELKKVKHDSNAHYQSYADTESVGSYSR